MEFYVDSISIKDNVYYVTGVCDKGSVMIDTCFLQVYQYITERNSKGFPVTTGKKYIRDIKLRVKQIEAYRSTLEELPEGMSGELWLTGEGGEHLQQKDLLVGGD